MKGLGLVQAAANRRLAVKKHRKNTCGHHKYYTWFTHSFGLGQNKVAKSASWVPLKWVKSDAWIREKKINILQGLGVGPSRRRRRKKKEEENKVGENNGHFRFRPPPWVAHESRQDQKSVLTMASCNWEHYQHFPRCQNCDYPLKSLLTNAHKCFLKYISYFTSNWRTKIQPPR